MAWKRELYDLLLQWKVLPSGKGATRLGSQGGCLECEYKQGVFVHVIVVEGRNGPESNTGRVAAKT